MEAYVVAWFVLSIAVAVLAGRRGRAWFGWLLLSLIVSPLVSGILLLILRPKGRQSKVTLRDGRQPRSQQDDNRFIVDVVGESHYQDNLARICGPRKTEGEHLVVTANVIPDDSNRYDPQAVKVEIRGLIVGHLARETARIFRQRHSWPVQCEALIAGGWGEPDDAPEDCGSYGVKLHLPD